MSGESGTESDIVGSENLQADVQELESDLEACQDDLIDMTQRKDELAEALEDAIDQLLDIENIIAITAIQKVYDENA